MNVWELRIEVRRSPDGQLQARLLRGTARGDPAEIVGWRDLAWGDLAARAAPLLVAFDPDLAIEIGAALGAGLHADLRVALAQLLTTASIRDVSVAPLGVPDVLSLPLETLAFETDAAPSVLIAPAPKGDVALRLELPVAASSTPRPPVPLGKLRVLFLVTSLEFPDARLRDATIAALVDTQRELLPLADAVEFVVACPKAYATQRAQRFEMITASSRHSVAVDEVYADATELEHMLRHGTLARRPDQTPERRPIHLLHLMGHHAKHGITLPGSPIPIAGPQLAAWLGPDALRVIFATGCATAPLAPHLLECADHVVTTRAPIDARHVPALCARLYQSLRHGNATSFAVNEARLALPADTRWVLSHLARAGTTRPFLSAEEQSLARYYANVYQVDRRLQLRFGDAQRAADLTTIHVPLEVVPEGKREEGEPGARHLTFRELVERPPARWLLRGGPGSGKSTTLRHYLLEPAAGRVPAFLYLPEWLRDPARPAGYKLDQILTSIESFLGVSGLIAALVSRAKDVVFLLDGYDELDDGERASARKIAATLDAAWKHTPIVVASRDTSDRELWQGWGSAALDPLRTDQQEDLLRRWFATERPSDAATLAQTWVQKLKDAGARVQEMAGNPLMLTFLADLALAGRTDIDRGRHALLADLLDVLLSRAYRAAEKKRLRLPDRDAVRSLLRHVAWEMTCVPTVLADPDDLRRWVSADTDGKDLQRAVGLDALLDLLAEEAGILRPQSGRKGSPWAFTHRQLLEALCAEHWWAIVLDEGRVEDAVGEVINHLQARIAAHGADTALDHWTEPVALLAARLPGGDRVVADIAPRNAEAALRVFSGIESVSAETVGTLLTTEPPSIERWPDEGKAVYSDVERRRVYELISDRCGRDEEPDRLVAVLADHGCRADVPPAERGAVIECLAAIGSPRLQDGVLTAIDRILRAHPSRAHPSLDHAAVSGLFRTVPGKPREELWRRIPGGTPFWMAATTVTNDQYRLFRARYLAPVFADRAEDFASVRREGDALAPVMGVSWFEATLFCRQLEFHRRGHPDAWTFLPEAAHECVFRLPTDAEWEYACRADTKTRYWSGNDEERDLTRVCWYGETSGRRVHAVAELPANPWGLYDMHGNVWEWCRDWWGDEQSGSPWGPSSGRGRVQRGGDCVSVAEWCRSGSRDRADPDQAVGFSGFRVVLAAAPPS